MKRAVTLLLVITLCACASFPQESNLQSNLKREMDKWVGRTFDELAAAKGIPSETYQLESGGRVYEYALKAAMKNVPIPATTLNVNAMAEGVRAKQKIKALKMPCEVQFVVSASNVIERWMTEGDCN